MALNLTQDEIFDVTRYYVNPTKDQRFYAVRSETGSNLKKDIKSIFKGGYTIIESFIGDSGENWGVIESKANLDSSLLGDNIQMLYHSEDKINPPAGVVFEDPVIPEDSDGEFPTFDEDNIPTEFLDSEDWNSWTPMLDEMDSLNSTWIQSIYTQHNSTWGFENHPTFSPFVDSNGYHWDSEEEKFVANSPSDSSE